MLSAVRRRWVVLGPLALFLLACTSASLRPDRPIDCASCAEWNRSQEPIQVFGNTYYVGMAGVSAVLIVSDDGHILLDGALPQSAPLIDANIRKLGFRAEDIRVIVNSHAHYDHAGGIAALQRASGATVVASEAGARALENGEPTPDDPQFGFGPELTRFPAIRQVRAIADGESLTVGDVTLTAHLTAGHTPGSTSWTWRACEKTGCLNIVYADSLSPVSAPGFRFTGDARTAGIIDTYWSSIETVAKLPCDILLTTHPGVSGLIEKLALRMADPGSNPFIDAGACRAYAETAARRLERRIAEEASEAG